MPAIKPECKVKDLPKKSRDFVRQLIKLFIEKVLVVRLVYLGVDVEEAPKNFEKLMNMGLIKVSGDSETEIITLLFYSIYKDEYVTVDELITDKQFKEDMGDEYTDEGYEDDEYEEYEDEAKEDY